MIELISSGSNASYKIQTKTISIMVNPTATVKGELVLLDHDMDYNPAEAQKVFSGAGEYEVKTTTVEGLAVDGVICYRIESQHVSLVHIASGVDQLTDAQVEKLAPVDIVLIESATITADALSKLVASLEPRVVVLRGASLELVKSASAEFGVEAEKNSKIKYNAKDLPQDSQKLYVLE